MKIIKKMTLILIAVIIMVAMLQVQSNAATGSISVGVSNSSPKIGDNVTVTLYFSPAMGTGDFTLNYNSSVVTYVSNTVGGTNTGSGVHVVYIDATNGAAIGSASFVFKVKAAGTATFSVSVNYITDASANELTPSAGSATISVKTATTNSTTPKTTARTNTATTETPTPEVTESPSPEPEEIVEETTLPTEVATPTQKAEEFKDQGKDKINLEEVKPQILLYIIILITGLALIEGIVIIILVAKVNKKIK